MSDEKLVWRNTGAPNGLRRFMTQKQYEAQTPGVQKWYEPIRYDVPEGWQLVPVKLTPKMWDAMNAGYQSPACQWDAALAAAPKPGEALDGVTVTTSAYGHADPHPMQPLVRDHTGRLRFKKNSVVEYLAEGRLNEVASRGYSDEDMTQLAQLIGYSLDGFSELSYVSVADYERAMLAAGREPNA